MRNFTNCIFTGVLLGLMTILSLGAIAQTAPIGIGTNISGTYNDTIMTQYGLFAQYRTYVANSVASGVSKVEFPIAQGNFTSVWRAYTTGQTLAGFNQIIDTTQAASARYNAAAGGSGILLPAVTGGKFYTFNVQNHGSTSTLNDTMAILETNYNPVVITNVTIPIDTNTIGPQCSPIVNATLSAPLSAGEYLYLRYSTNLFDDSSIVILMTVTGTAATAQIPAYPAGTHIQYYVLSSPIASLITTGPGSAYYDCLTLNIRTGSIGNNYRYTVKTLPTPGVTIRASLNPVCSGTPDVFIAHGFNNGTLASDYQWYKNHVTVGTNDSIYTDATLVTGDSVWVVMQANLGCPILDTSSHIIITTKPLSSHTQYDTICHGYSFIENGHAYTTSNTYQDTFFNAAVNGCDSIVITHLTVKLTPTYTQYDTICSGTSFIEHGHTYTTANTYIDTFTNAAVDGCDSIVTTVLTVTPLARFTQSPSICQGTSFIENGHTYTTSNTYLDTFFNASVRGCDSIVTTILTVKSLAAYTQSPSICQGASFIENGHTYTIANTYLDTFFNAAVNGCDSIVTTILTVKSVVTHTQSPSICQGHSFIENGHTYTSSNTYLDTFFNASVAGCDSIVTTILTVNPIPTYTQSPSICQGSSFIEHGHTYTTSNTYLDTFFNASVTGCDSIVTTILTVKPLSYFAQYDTICQGGSFIENGHTYTTANTYQDTFSNVSSTGCDSIVTTHLTVNTPAVVITNPTNQTVASGNTATFTAGAGGTPTPTVQWQVSTDGGATFSDIPGATSTVLNVPATTLAMNGYEYQAVFTNSCGTATTTVAVLTVISPSSMTVTTQPSKLSVCANTTATFTAYATGTPAPTVQWQVSTDSGATFSDIPGATSATLSFTATAADNGNEYWAIFTSGSAQDTTALAILTVYQLPTVTVGPDTSILLGQTVQLYSIASGSTALLYSWTPDSFLNSNNVSSPVYSGSDSVIFQLRVTDLYGCAATAYDTVNVIIPDNIVLPNIITPNGDGYNDTWVLNSKINLAGSHLIIFDRWGEKVYESTSYANNWGGTYMNTDNKLPDGTYYFVLTVTAQNNHTYEGPINILSSK